MDIDKKMKELAELFSKTGNELSEMVKKNEKFMAEEIRRVQEAIRGTSEVLHCSPSNENPNSYKFNSSAEFVNPPTLNNLGSKRRKIKNSSKYCAISEWNGLISKRALMSLSNAVLS